MPGEENEDWIRVQVKTFTRWANRYLSERMMKINDLRTDFADGIMLINLMEIISGKSLGKYVKSPKMKLQKLENINVALSFLRQHVRLENIGAADIEQGNLKLILATMWCVILRFQVSADGSNGSPKMALLEWVNKRIAPYKRDNIDQVDNFTTSWSDGRALSALVDSLSPGVIDIKNLSTPLRNCDNAIAVASKEFDIPLIIDGSDIVNTPDEHSMMTYISFFRDWVEGDGKKKKEEEAARLRAAEEEAARKRAAIARALTWTASGPGLVKGWKLRNNLFTISNAQNASANVGEFVIIVKGPESFMGSVTESDLPSRFEGSYRPPEVGQYSIDVRLGGEPIAKSPFSVQVNEASVSGMSWAEGPGLISARDDQPATFTVFCRDANNKPVIGEDALEVLISEDKTRTLVKASITDQKNGSYTVKYETKVPGDYTIMVQIDGQPIKDMPRRVHVARGKDLDALKTDINRIRERIELPKRVFTEEELGSPKVEENLGRERDKLQAVEKLVQQIQQLRMQLGMPKRVFTEAELTGPHAERDLTAERDGLQQRLLHKQAMDPIIEEIQRLRKAMDLPPRVFTNDELWGPTSLADRTNERDHLKKIQPVHDEIHQLRKKLEMPRRVFKEDELTGPRSYPEREKERDDLLAMLGTKDKTAPVVAEIQRLRQGLGLPPRQFKEEELTGPTAFEDRVKERDDLRDVTDLVQQIQKLRKQMELPARVFAPTELTEPQAVAKLTNERDNLASMVPLHDEIHSLRSQLNMPRRVFKEPELTGKGRTFREAFVDRTKERDELRAMLDRMKLCEPICTDIHKLRDNLLLPKRQFAFEELTGVTSVDDRTAERAHLQTIQPITVDIASLRKDLGMPVRQYQEAELTGKTSIPDRVKERDELQEKLEQKNIIDPLIAEIQAVRKTLGLAPRKFTDEELWGPTAIKDRRKELADLKAVVPLKDEIADLRKRLDMEKREYKEAELAGPTAVVDRTKERDDLLDKLGNKILIDPIIAEIQELRRRMELAPKQFTKDELSGPTAVRDRIKERDDLKKMVELFDQIQDLRKQLEWNRRQFTEPELTGKTSYPDRVVERDDLIDRLSRKKITDPLCKEIQQLRRYLDLPVRNFTEEEKTGPNAIDDRTAERDALKEVTTLVDQIQAYRKEGGLKPAVYNEQQLIGKNAVKDRQEERDIIQDTVPLAHEIHELVRKLGDPPREFKEIELTGPRAVRERTDERDNLLDRLARKKQCEPLLAQIQKLRNQMSMSPRDFTEAECEQVTERMQERDDLQEMVPIESDIQKLRRKLELPIREFRDDELYGATAIPDRKKERDGLLKQLDQKTNLDPILAEIQRLRKQVDLAPRKWTDAELNGPTAIADRTKERDDLKQVVPLTQEIHKLRKQLDMDRRTWEEKELTGPRAVPERTKERDDLLEKLNRKKNLDPLIAEIQKLRGRMDLPPREFKEAEITKENLTPIRDQLRDVLPLHDEIHALRSKCEMSPREFTERELTGPKAIPERKEERDDLLARLAAKRDIDPVLSQIQRLRAQLELAPRHFTEEEMYGPTALQDRTHERDILKDVIPLEAQIQRLHKALEMDPRKWQEQELAGQTAVEDRTEERDGLLARLNTKKAVSPLVREIQKLRAQIDLPPKEFTEEELFGENAVEELTVMRDNLREMVPLYSDIRQLHHTLGVPERKFSEDELCGVDAVPERTYERNRLREIPPLCDEIHLLRKELGMTRRKWNDDELVGPSNVEDRIAERDALRDKLDHMRSLQPLINELQSLRKQLEMPQRVFEEGELDRDDADQMLQHEIDELKKLLNRRGEADALAAEIQALRKELHMDPRVFTEEELDAKDAVPKLTKERDDLRAERDRRRAVGDLPEQINRLRAILDMPPRVWPKIIPISMVPQLEEERDDLEDECKRRRARADELLPKIEKLWNYLHIPTKDRPNLSLRKDEIPSKPWLDRAEAEYERLRALLKDQLKDKLAEQQALLHKLWDQLHVPEDARAKFYRGIPDLYSEEGLQIISDEVIKLHNQLLSSKKLIKLILTRKKFIQEMLEFEVIASDPRRLFKGSAQLMKEEQFRRSAYPTLLDLEEQIKMGLTDFERETGEPFMWEGQYYLVTLETEIAERPMDPVVFGIGMGANMKKQQQDVKIAKAKAAPATPATKSPTPGVKTAAKTPAAAPKPAAKAATPASAGKRPAPAPPPPGFKAVTRKAY